jgi:two-component system KDP operon response regulator KdpE
VSHKVLVIDDDPMLLELLRTQLERVGFSVITALDGRIGVQRLRDAHPDIVLLDIMMPEVDGWNTYQQLRQISDTPIIVLTAKAGTQARTKGLALGIDDYLTKPYDLWELVDRIQRILDRDGGSPRNGRHLVYDNGSLHIDVRSGTVARGREPIDLSPTELRLLMYMASRRGQTIPYKELLTRVWGPEYADEEPYLHAYIRHLRKKIEPDPRHPKYICARQKAGYAFAGDDAPTDR